MREGKKRIMEREAKSLRRKREGGEMRKRRKKRKEESGGERTEAMSSNLHNASSFDNYTHSARYRCAVFIWLCAHERQFARPPPGDGNKREKERGTFRFPSYCYVRDLSISFLRKYPSNIRRLIDVNKATFGTDDRLAITLSARSTFHFDSAQHTWDVFRLRSGNPKRGNENGRCHAFHSNATLDTFISIARRKKMITIGSRKEKEKNLMKLEEGNVWRKCLKSGKNRDVKKIP